MIQPANANQVHTPPAAIAVEHLCVRYATGAGPIVALDDLSCVVQAGEFVALVGPSGCGKSTLLRTIGGLLAPDAGRITLAGLTPEVARRRRLISFVFQQPVLLPWRTALQNVALPLWVAGRSRREREATARHFLDLVGLEQFADAYPHQLSGGMQQRVALARALSFSPAVLLMDEPFGALDELTRERLNVELLRIWSTSGATVLFVTHSLTEAVFLADRVLVLTPRPGRVVATLPVNLPRPRSAELLEQADFLQQVTALRRLLRNR